MAIEYIWGTGRRKSAVARVRIAPGDGTVVVNKRPLNQYFSNDQDRMLVLEPLKLVERGDKYNVYVSVTGSGATGQAGAIRHGLARALAKAEPAIVPVLRNNKVLTRDPRMKERKKYGKRGARRGQQYSKR
ncbi:MAG TPA: 30S ribosomal protein S9 [Planctomycetota bacterium]|nr:30S ribosomal protein S9 [Planctomycetota bacterium]